MAQINRTGTVHFGDASLSVWEEGIADARKAGGHAGEKDWEQAFKRDVFARIVQTLHRLGWACEMPAINEHDVKHYGGTVARWAAERRRECSKGDLKGELNVCSRHIEFKMWQGVNTPTRPDHGGRYGHDKEGCMPYLLRLEMERTRRRIRDYLCNVFAGYEFDTSRGGRHWRVAGRTAMEAIQRHYDESWHFKGVDWDKRKAEPGMVYNLKSGDGQQLEHGQRVWTTDHKGRWVEGTALYNINNMWWVVLGRYDYINKANFDLHVTPPENPRAKKNDRQSRKRLENELAKAVKSMNFRRAEVLKNVLWPKPEPLFFIMKGDAYFAPNYCGYRDNPVDAGRYTEAELKPYAGDIKNGSLKAVPASA